MDGISISLDFTQSAEDLEQPLCRRTAHSDLLDILMRFLQDQSDMCGTLRGFKMMRLKCIQAGNVVTQEAIRSLLPVWPFSRGISKYHDNSEKKKTFTGQKDLPLKTGK